MLTMLLIATFGLSSRTETASCDLIEVNHFYNADNKLQFRQLIFYDWNPEYNRHDIVTLDGSSCFIIVPEDDVLNYWPSKQGDLYIVQLDKQRRKIRAKMFIETWTQYDREVAKRHLVNPSDRRALFPPRGAK